MPRNHLECRSVSRNTLTRLVPVRLAAIALLLFAAPAAAQNVTATRTDQPIILDGIDSEPAWSTAPLHDEFRESRPSEGADPKQRTAFRVLYDPENLYVFVRAFDTEPDSIVALLSRRDVQTSSDQIMVMIDSYRDRRTGYEFVTNPAGV